MIFVTLGTHELPFKRLLEYIEKLDIDDEVIIQSGNTEFSSMKYKVVPFMDSNDFDNIINQCDLVICHAGVGTILSALKKNKKIIALPRLSKYNEHNDDHQLEIATKFDKKGYIITCLNYAEFEQAVYTYKEKNFHDYCFDNSKIMSFIQSYIEGI